MLRGRRRGGVETKLKLQREVVTVIGEEVFRLEWVLSEVALGLASLHDTVADGRCIRRTERIKVDDCH